MSSTERLEKVWGGNSGANAYILKYRRVGYVLKFPAEPPPDVKAEVEIELAFARKMEEGRALERLLKKRARVLIRRMDDLNVKFEIEVYPEMTIQQLMEKTFQCFGVSDRRLDRARLRRFKTSTQTWTSTVLQTFDDCSPSSTSPAVKPMFRLSSLNSPPPFEENTKLRNTFIFNTGSSKSGLL